MMKKVLILLLALSMLFCICACSDKPEADESKNESGAVSVDESKEESKPVEYSFKVKVVDENGNAVNGVTVQLCKDTCIFNTTDASGTTGFNAEITEGYKLSVLDCPDGYEYTGEAEIYLESGIDEYTITLNTKQ